jgi:hypothetical protein
VEQRRQQFPGLRGRRHPGRRLRSDASRQSRYRAWRNRFRGGYTYFDLKTGNEFSGVAGATYNFKNTSTQYQNGIDFHFDWGASHFFQKQFQLGLVGYYFQQITDDFGAPAALDGFRSRVAGVGPQVGFLFPLGNMQGYINLKGYKEFAAQNRPEGWNAWLTFAISPAAEPPLTTTAKPMITK